MSAKQVLPIIWENNTLKLIDQRQLPHKKIYQSINSLEGCHNGIKDMVVRGAPCIGFTALFAMALWSQNNQEYSKDDLNQACDYLISARPTAVNLEYEVRRVQVILQKALDENSTKEVYKKIIKFAQDEMNEAYEKNLLMAKYALDELTEIYGPSKLRILTHCNTGTLACGTLGTALGVISHLHTNQLIEKVWVDETRPYLQGSRLTSYELKCEGIPHEIVVEGAASLLMGGAKVDAIFVGADRIAANRDTANKVGTCNLAIIANYFQIPFYVVAPLSSFDLNTDQGSNIEIELRDPNEILKIQDKQIAPNGVTAFNPSFDITPSELIKGVICEKGIYRHGNNLTEVLDHS